MPNQRTRQDAFDWMLYNGIIGSLGYNPTPEYTAALKEQLQAWIERINAYERQNFKVCVDEDAGWIDEDRLGFGIEPN